MSLSELKYNHTPGDTSVINQLQAGLVPLDDLAIEHYCSILDGINLIDEDHMDSLTYDDQPLALGNFIYGDKDPGDSGSWIKVRDGSVMKLVFAKRAKKKDDPYYGLRKALADLQKNILDKDLALKASYFKILAVFDASPVYIVYNRTKTQKVYLRPNEYELVDDINYYVDAAVDGVPGLKMKPIWTERNKDQIFYLQSRGISKDRAIVMAAMDQTIFEFNLEIAMNAFNEQIRNSIVIHHG